MKSRTSDLENSNAQLEEKIQKLDDDRSDIIAYLEKTLKTKTNDLAELQQRFDGLTEVYFFITFFIKFSTPIFLF